MKKINLISTGSLFLLLAPSAVATQSSSYLAQAPQAPIFDTGKYIELEASLNASYAQWDSGLSQENENGLTPRVEYDTESLSFTNTGVNLKVLGYQTFSYNKLASSGTNEQTKALQKNSNNNSGVNGYGLCFSPELLIGLLDIKSSFIKTALTYRINYKDESYYGNATAKENLAYWYTSRTTGIEGRDFDRLEQGDSLSFKTDFKHTEHTVSLKYLDSKNRQKSKNTELRVGLYSTSYTKPAFMGSKLQGGEDIIEDVEYDTKGIILTASNFDITKHNTHNYTASIYYGVDNDMVANGYSTADNLDEEYSLDYFAVFFDYSYKKELLGSKNHALFILGGASVDYKKWSISHNNSDQSLDLEAETLYKGYFELNYKFSI